MFLRTDFQGNRCGCWNTMPTSGRGRCIGLPSTITAPLYGISRPAMVLSTVDLPHPDGPTMQTNSP